MMTNRRIFLKQASMLVTGGLLSSYMLPNYGATVAAKKHIGLQLYSLRDDLKEIGLQKTLEIVAKMGYVNLETSGYNDGKIYNLQPTEFKKIIDGSGLTVTSAHLNRNPSNNHDEDMKWWSKAIEAYAIAGVKYMMIPSSSLDGRGATMDNVKRYGDYFNEIGLMTARSGVALGYHNHAYEFKNKIDGVPIYDLLLKVTSPDHVLFENDVYWTKQGGYDAVDYLKKYPNRIKVLHIKDDKAIGASGKIDFKAIFDQAYANGIKDWYVEVEEYNGTPQEDVKQSYDFLANADYVK